MITLKHSSGIDCPPVTMELPDAVDVTVEDRKRDALAKLNYAWFDARAAEIYELHRGKCLCVAGQELFVAATATEAAAMAKAAHPDDTGRITRYIPNERAHRIYANRRTVVSL